MGRDSNEIDRIYPMSLFIAKVAKIISSNDKISETDLQAILIYLSREKAVIDYNDKVSHTLIPSPDYLVTSLLACQVQGFS